MSNPKAVALYARISSDVEGDGAGVRRQLEDCRALATQLGWPVAEEYVDNDISAFSGKRRPAYVRMLEDLEARERDAVIVYHQDRLTRRPTEMEAFMELADRVGLREVKFVSGPAVDLGSGDGLFMLRIMSAVAANESASKSRRVRRKLDQVAAEGRPHGGSRHPYGYEPDMVTVRPGEAELIRTLADRYLAGEGLRSLAEWMNDQGHPTRFNKGWRTSTVKTLLTSPRLAGLRQHRGIVVGKAVWDPIIPVEVHERLVAKFSEKAATGRRVPRRYLLTGMMRCGLCHTTMYAHPRESTRRYVCTSGPDHRGCGKMAIVADPVETLIAEAVLLRLDSPELAASLAGRTTSTPTAIELSDEISADEAQLEELSQMYGNREINAREWRAAREPIDRRLSETRRRLARESHADALVGFLGTPGLRDRWASLNLTRQRAIVQAVLEFVAVSSSVVKGPRFDPNRVHPHWRV